MQYYKDILTEQRRPSHYSNFHDINPDVHLGMNPGTWGCAVRSFWFQPLIYTTVENGDRWAKQHPEADMYLGYLTTSIGYVATKFGVTIESALNGGSCNVVVGTSDNNQLSVLKEYPPWNTSAKAEIAALELRNGDCTPKVLDRMQRPNAVLLERIIPGTPPQSLDVVDVANIITRFSKVPDCIPHEIPPLSEAIKDRFERALENRHKLVSPEQITHARSIALKMAVDGEGRWGLVHGDFLTKNVLECNKRGYALIDPMSSYGDVSYDAALWNISNPIGITERCDKLAPLLSVPAERLLAWSSVLAVPEICLASRPRAEATRDFLATTAISID